MTNKVPSMKARVISIPAFLARRLLPPTVATNDEMYDAYAAGYDNGYVKGQGDLLALVGAKHVDELTVR